VRQLLTGWRSRPVTIRFWRACGFALLLLFVQHLALTHALEHLAADTLLLDQGDDASDCPQCQALGGLHLGGGAAAASWLQASGSGGALGFVVAADPPRRIQTAHAIRAPPENRD